MQCSTKRSPHLPTIQIYVGGIYFCDITNKRKQICSPKEPFVVVLEKGCFKTTYPFGVEFEICNFVDLFMPKHTHYTLTKVQKVITHNRTPLISSQWGPLTIWLPSLFKISHFKKEPHNKMRASKYSFIFLVNYSFNDLLPLWKRAV